jgi:hypothetical protein
MSIYYKPTRRHLPEVDILLKASLVCKWFRGGGYFAVQFMRLSHLHFKEEILSYHLKRIISLVICYYFQQNGTCSAGEVRSVLPSVAAVEPSSSEPPAEAVVSE